MMSTCLLQVRAVWPKTNDSYMHIAIHDDRSKNFCYRSSDNLLLRMGPEVSCGFGRISFYEPCILATKATIYMLYIVLNYGQSVLFSSSNFLCKPCTRQDQWLNVTTL